MEEFYDFVIKEVELPWIYIPAIRWSVKYNAHNEMSYALVADTKTTKGTALHAQWRIEDFERHGFDDIQEIYPAYFKGQVDLVVALLTHAGYDGKEQSAV